MTVPNFFIIGAQKAGTTWLQVMIKRHPDAFMTHKKETDFFCSAQKYAKGLDWYLEEHFSDHNGESAVGEASPNYLPFAPSYSDYPNHPDPAQLLHRHFPEAKLIVSFRDPVERSISAFYHFIKGQAIPPNARITSVLHRKGILENSFYDRHLERWLQFFPREQMLVLFFETDIVQNKVETMRRIYRFLDIDDTFVPNDIHQKHNAKRSDLFLRLNYHSSFLARATRKLLPESVMESLWPIAVSEDERTILTHIFESHNQRLADLLDCSLPWPSAERVTRWSASPGPVSKRTSESSDVVSA